jgi:hypothetical protein
MKKTMKILLIAKKWACLSILLWATASVQAITVNDMPANVAPFVKFSWDSLMVAKSASTPNGEGSCTRWNTIFDQIVANNGKLNYVVRWQSDASITLAERKALADTLSNYINDWAQYMIGYENWPYKKIEVNVVAWAVADKNLLQDLQSDEVVYTDYTTDDLHSSNSAIPEKLPYAPTQYSRAEHFTESNYDYGNGEFDMYAWCTDGWAFGGVGGDWGQRTSYSQWITYPHIIKHEMGHGFGMLDYYDDYKFYTDPTYGKFGDTVKSIMISGNSMTITEYDYWMLRYMWSQIKDESGRFPNLPSAVVSDTATLTKHGVGKSSQTVTKGNAISEFNYVWTNADNVEVNGLPTGITATIDATDKKVTISGTANDAAGTYTYTISTTGSNVNISKTGTITITENTGIQCTNSDNVEVMRVEYYDLTGRQLNENAKGLMIMKETLKNGEIRYEKAIRK